MAIKYFVELLSRIGSVSIFIQSDDNDSLQVERLTQVDSLLLKLQLSNTDSPVFIPLPTQVPPLENLEALYKENNGQISIRLPLLTNGAHNRSTNHLMSMATRYKWDSKYLQNIKPGFQLHCSSCDITICDSSQIAMFSEMPSELWAEMMDFWHCHKPHDHNEISSERFTTLKPITNGIITGSYYFAFNIEDLVMKNIEKKARTICCTNCHSLVGEFDRSSGLQKIFKWALKLKYNDIEETYKPHNYIYTSLLDTINSNATRVVEFASADESKRVLIWVFNVGVDFIVSGSSVLKDGLKVYYTTDIENIEAERAGRGELEQITVSDAVLTDTILHLDHFNSKLPNALKTMGQNWKLGLIVNE